MRHRFQTEQWLPYSLQQTFLFFADSANLPRLMPDWQKARIEKTHFVPPLPPADRFPGSESVLTGDGTELTLTIRPFPLSPVRLPWVAVIEDFRWLEGFCDVQRSGPFKYWRHCHSVATERRDGLNGTHLLDAVDYELPLGPLGDMANAAFVRGQLQTTFAFRHTRTLQLMTEHAR